MNLVALGDEPRALHGQQPEVNADWKMRAGFEVHAPDMSMFTLGGGGVHCLSQSLCRDPAIG